MASFGELIYEARKAKRISQSDLIEKIIDSNKELWGEEPRDVLRALKFINRIECYNFIPSLNTMYHLARVLDIPFETLNQAARVQSMEKLSKKLKSDYDRFVRSLSRVREDEEYDSMGSLKKQASFR